jgi:subtilisin family serine protease
MAPQALLYSWSLKIDLPDYATQMDQGVQNHGIVVGNNSWCWTSSMCSPPNQIQGDYYPLCGDWDKLVRKRDLHLFFSAGNYRNDPAFGGNNFRSVNPPGTAKNVICVGAIDKFDNPAGFSGWGPCDDGRLKPDLVAVGVGVKSTTSIPANNYDIKDGTSMSCPAVAGTAALLIERFRQQNGGATPRPALLKNILLNTATDLGPSAPTTRSVTASRTRLKR